MKYTSFALVIGAIALAYLPPSLATPPQDPTLQIPNDFQSGTPALASEVNQNFQEIQTHSNQMSADIADIAARISGSENLVTVASEGGDFASVSGALAFAGSLAAQISERVVVVLLPGTYSESVTLAVPNNVTLQGSSRTGTLLRVLDSPALELADGAEVASLSVQNTLNAAAVIGIRVTDALTSVLIEDVRVLPPDPQTSVTGIAIFESIATIRDTEVLVADVGNIGVPIRGSASMTSLVVIEGSLIEAGGLGMDAFIDCEVTVRHSVFRASTPILARFDGTNVFIQGSDLVATNNGTVINASQDAEVSLGASRVAGNNPSIATGGSVRFVHCYKADYTAIANGDNSSTQ